jgi:hypothetical protein
MPCNLFPAPFSVFDLTGLNKLGAVEVPVKYQEINRGYYQNTGHWATSEGSMSYKKRETVESVLGTCYMSEDNKQYHWEEPSDGTYTNKSSACWRTKQTTEGNMYINSDHCYRY